MVNRQKDRMPRAFTLMELTVGLFVVLAALGVGVAALTQNVQARRIESQRSAAREVAGLQLERLRAATPEDLPAAGQSREIAIPPLFAGKLKGAKCSAEVSAVAGEPALIRVKVTVKPKGAAKAESAETVLRK